MDSISKRIINSTFPLDTIRKITNKISYSISAPNSNYSVNVYDNRGKTLDAATNLKSKLKSFKTRLKASSFFSDSFLWNIKTGISSDYQSLLVKASTDAKPDYLSFEIDSIASTRTAISNKLANDNLSTFATGTYSYNLIVNDKTYSDNINLKNDEGDPLSNKEVLQKLNSSINGISHLVQSELHETFKKDYSFNTNGEYKKTSYLVVENKDVGDEINFYFKDTSGNLIEQLNLDKISDPGYKADFTINGVLKESDFNEIKIEDDTLDVFLLNETKTCGNVSVMVKQDYENLANELVNILNDYNDLIEWIDDNNTIIKTNIKKTLFDDISSVAINKNLNFDTSASKAAKKEENALEMYIESITQTNNKDEYTLDLSSFVKADNTNTLDNDFDDIGLSLKYDGTIDITEEFTESITANFKDIYDTLADDNGFFTKISSAIDEIYDNTENRYIYNRQTVLAYDEKGNKKSTFLNNSNNLISIFV